MKTVFDTIRKSDQIHSMAYTPIHSQIQSIIPHLELRTICAKRFSEFDSRLTPYEREALLKEISNCNEKIKELIYITPFESL